MTQPATGFGGASNVQGGASYAGNPFGPSITGPNAAAYNGLLAGANAASAGYAQQGANYTQAAPTIANPYQAGSQQALAGTNAGLTGLEGTLMQTAAGQGPAVAAAQAQMQGATDQNIAAQTAMARSATGGALAQQGAQLAGQGNIASTLGQAASSSANTLAQQQLAAAQAAGSVYGTQGGLQMNQYQLEQQQAQQQAQLASVSQGAAEPTATRADRRESERVGAGAECAQFLRQPESRRTGACAVWGSAGLRRRHADWTDRGGCGLWRPHVRCAREDRHHERE